MDSAIDSTPAQQATVGGIDNGIHLQCGDIRLYDSNHGLSLLINQGLHSYDFKKIASDMTHAT
jgi:hypothetical protein